MRQKKVYLQPDCEVVMLRSESNLLALSSGEEVGNSTPAAYDVEGSAAGDGMWLSNEFGEDMFDIDNKGEW